MLVSGGLVPRPLPCHRTARQQQPTVTVVAAHLRLPFQLLSDSCRPQTQLAASYARDWGPFYEASTATSSATKAVEQAIATPLNDLTLDFDRAYINSRRNTCGINSIAVGCGSFITDVLLEYQQLVSAPSQTLNVEQCGLLIAKHAYPDLVASKYIKQLEDLACQVREERGKLNGSGTPLQAINRVLYEQHKFHGNSLDFYDEENHCLNKVLQTKAGSPAALALLYLAIARRTGLELKPVLLPSHTFLREANCSSSFVMDPFNAGQICSKQVVEARLNGNWGLSSPMISLAPGLLDSAVADDRRLLLRLLANLRESYWAPLPTSGAVRWSSSRELASSNRAMMERALWIVRFMRATAPELPQLVRDEGYVLACMGHHDEASHLFSRYLAVAPDAEDATKVQEFIISDSRRNGNGNGNGKHGHSNGNGRKR